MSSTDWESLQVQETEEVDANLPAILAECCLPQLTQKLGSCFQEIGQYWLEIGWPAELRNTKLNDIVKSFENFIRDMAENERQELINGRNFKDFKLSQVNKILIDLTLEPLEVPKNLSIVEANQMLVQRFNKLNMIKEDRMKSYDTIEEKLTKVCHALGMDYIKPILATNIPSESELKIREEEYLTLHKELKEKMKVYESLKSTIKKAINQLEYQVSEKAEQMIIESNASDFIYSSINMNVLKNFNQKILSLHHEAHQQMQEMSKTLHLLYIRLSVPETERKLFTRALDSCPTFPTKMHKLSEEIAKYEIIKKQSIEKITKSVREDLRKLFEQAYVKDFDESILKEEVFTEELLDLHEAEYKQLKHFYETYSFIFQKMEEYKVLLEELLEAEKFMADPNKFSNRGGALLTAQQTLRRTKNKIDKLISDIKNAVEVNKGKTDIPFDAYGLDLDVFFSFCEKEFKSMLEEYKNSFKKAPEAPKGTFSPKKNGSAKKPTRAPLSPKIVNRPAPPTFAGSRIPAPSNTSNKTKPTPSSSSGRKRPLDEERFRKFIHEKELLHSTILGPTEEEENSVTKRKRRF